MDEVTLVGAGLIGAGIAILGLALLVVGRRVVRAGRGRRPPLPRSSRPRPAPARPAPAQPRPDLARPPRLRPAPDPAPRRRPPGPKAAGEALDGETLMLGPVPAWRLPVHQRGAATGADARAADRSDESAPVRRGLAPMAVPVRNGATSALFARSSNGSRPAGEDGPAPAEEGPDEAARGEPAQFGWFRPGR